MIQWLHETLGSSLDVEMLIRGVVYLVVGLIILRTVSGRVRAEMRQNTWNKLPLDQKLALIYAAASEGFEIAEWLFSHLTPQTQAEKRRVAQRKQRQAVQFARKQLQVQGAGRPDLGLVPGYVERAALRTKNGGKRWGPAGVS